MKSKKNILTLLIIIVVIIATPLVFFNYIGSEPMFKPKNTTDQIAIVNEDEGYQKTMRADVTVLGQDLVQTIEDGESEYEWSALSRSAAEEGIGKKEYDAIIYIPSSFSRDIMSFKGEAPNRTNVRYEISPHLNAKNQERVQKELETIQQQLNEQVTAMYWRYISEEVHAVQTNFDGVLDKEVDFLDEMYAFYAPSSKELGKEIDHQRNRIEQLFVNSKESTGLSSNSKENLEQAQKEFETLTKNIDAYLKYQEEMTTTLLDTDEANQVLLDTASTNFRTLLQQGEQNIVEGQTPFEPKLENTGQAVYTYLGDFHEGMTIFNDNKDIFNESMDTVFKQLDTEITGLRDTHKSVLQNYNTSIFKKTFEIKMDTVTQRRGPLTQTDTPEDRLVIPEGLEVLATDTLKEAQEKVTAIQSLIALNLEPSDPDNPDNPGDPGDPDDPGDPGDPGDDRSGDDGSSNDQSAWQNASDAADELEKKLREHEGNISTHNDSISQYKKDFDVLIDYMEALEEQSNTLPQSMIEKITATEARILERAPQFASHFEAPIQSRDPNALMEYYGLLTTLDFSLVQYQSSEFGVIDQNAADIAINGHGRIEELSSKIGASETNVTSFMKAAGTISKFEGFSAEAQDAMNKLIADTNGVLEQLRTDITEEQQFVLTELGETRELANTLLGELKSNRQPLEVEEGPVEGLNGTLVQTSQQTSLSDIEQLGSSVSSLNDRQDNLIGSTEEMFNQVASVQNKSDDLNDRWKNSVGTTKLVYDDMNGILSNAINDGYYNDSIYKHLSNPVDVSGEQLEGPSEQFTPPIVMLVIVLIVSLLIGYLAHHYGYMPIPVHLSLYAILSVALGLIISIYGLNIYKMNDAQAIQWTIVTVLLILATAGVIRLLLMIGPWIGVLGSVLIIFLFTTPLLDMAMPNFSADNPIAELFMSIQYQEQTLFVPGVIVLAAITCLAIAIPIVKHIRAQQQLRSEAEEEHYEV